MANELRADASASGLGPASNTPTGSIRCGNDNKVTPRRSSEASINELIEKEIIPQLLISHSTPGVRSDFFDGRRVTPDEIRSFAELPLTKESDFLIKEVERLQQSGASTESIFVDLLAASARRLGEMWEEDICDFVDVTIGLWRLQDVMRNCAIRTIDTPDSGGAPHSALFLPFPGESHIFGTLMVEEVFANAGWRSEVMLDPERHELLHMVAERKLDLIGLTISCSHPCEEVSELISAIRSVSRNPDIRILIGGSLVNGDPSIATNAGADGTAPDARTALTMADDLVVGAERASTSVN